MSHPNPQHDPENTYPDDVEMSKKDGQQMLRAFAGFDLTKIREEMEGIAGGWNGEDSQFIHEGELYHEDDATQALDIVEAIDALQDLLDNFRK